MNRNPALHAVTLFVRELVAAGVTRVVVSPGSRSTPLTIACARQQGLTVYNVLDERSAAFFALGMARATRFPVGLICTSGTAAANYLPAVVEAHYSRIPLVLLTADRPPELRGIGSNQTIWQQQLYGPYVKWFYEMPLPETSSFIMLHARSQAVRAVTTANRAPQGPVHINWPFREPLLAPTPEEQDDFAQMQLPVPLAKVHTAPLQVQDTAADIAESLKKYRRGLIICGPRDDEFTAAAARELSRQTGWVLLADPLSQARTGCAKDDDRVLWEYDTLLRAWDPDARQAARPEVIIRTGATPTSKVLGECLTLWRGVRHIVVDEAVFANDPFLSATDFVQASPGDWLTALAAHLPLSRADADPDYSALWQAGQTCVQTVTDEYLRASEALSEGRVFVELAEQLPEGSCLFVGNSMPVRDLDSFFPCTPKALRIVANRGASGIDGVVSAALGTAVASGMPCTLVIGDLSFLHDLGGLLAARQQGIRLTIIVIHNDGGGIFSFLPQAQETDVFSHFSTPHGLSLQAAAALFGGHYTRIDTWSTFRDALAEAQQRNGWSLLELPSDRDDNLTWHRSLWQAVLRQWEKYAP